MIHKFVYVKLEQQRYFVVDQRHFLQMLLLLLGSIIIKRNYIKLIKTYKKKKKLQDAIFFFLKNFVSTSKNIYILILLQKFIEIIITRLKFKKKCNLYNFLNDFICTYSKKKNAYFRRHRKKLTF